MGFSEKCMSRSPENDDNSNPLTNLKIYFHSERKKTLMWANFPPAILGLRQLYGHLGYLGSFCWKTPMNINFLVGGGGLFYGRGDFSDACADATCCVFVAFLWLFAAPVRVHTQGGRATTPLPRRVPRRVLETASEKVRRRVPGRCHAVSFWREEGS